MKFSAQIGQLLRETVWLGPLCIGVIAFLMVASAVDPAGDYPARWEGPGLTVDEIFNADWGVRAADRLFAADVAGVIKVGQTLPDHPPLARLWLGLVHEMVLIVAPPPSEHAPIVIGAARVGSGLAFGLLVGFLGTAVGRMSGPLAGSCSAIALCFMPRVFGHAHLASLETVLNLTYVAALLQIVRWWHTPEPPTLRAAAWCGLFLGFAALTKIQAVFIPIPVIVWAILNWRLRAVVPLIVWALTGTLVFFGGWPWLWLDPVGHLLKFLGHASDRSAILVWYCGRAFSDKQVPWHYPWVLFATTVPVGLHLLGVWGFLCPSAKTVSTPSDLRWQPRWLLRASVLFPLLVFSVPQVSVYDGERLFLIVYPLWAIFCGLGAASCYDGLRQRSSPRVAGIALAMGLLGQSVGLWQLAPCWLSYYNVGVGGLAGARQLGFSPTYWGDSVTREVWQQAGHHVPAGSVIHIGPILHPFQIPAWESQCPLLRERQWKLVPLDLTQQPQYVIRFERLEYLDGKPLAEHDGYRPLFLLQRQGVTLAGLYEQTDTNTIATPAVPDNTPGHEPVGD